MEGRLPRHFIYLELSWSTSHINVHFSIQCVQDTIIYLFPPIWHDPSDLWKYHYWITIVSRTARWEFSWNRDIEGKILWEGLTGLSRSKQWTFQESMLLYVWSTTRIMTCCSRGTTTFIERYDENTLCGAGGNEVWPWVRRSYNIRWLAASIPLFNSHK